MAKTELDSFEYAIRHQAKFIKSTMKESKKVKDSYLGAKKTREIIFGFNRKQDNFNKTNQLRLFDL